MSRIVKKIQLSNPKDFSEKLLQWANTYHDTFAWLDSNNYPQKYSSFEKILAVGVKSDITTDDAGAFAKIDRYQQQVQDYLFGYFTYDLKNDTENLKSENPDFLYFPDAYFFQPLKLFFIKENTLEVHYDLSCKDILETDLNSIKNTQITDKISSENIPIKQRVSEDKYYEKIKNIQNHINRGDSYELNFCMEFYAKKVINPLQIFKALNSISAAPFSVFFKHQQHYILSASPERFVRKEGQKIISQPIKGTIKRGRNPKEDKQLIQKLKADPKEHSENIMIVDLVRNDLSKTAAKSSVQVEELCEVYTFKQVHQLISTITSQVKEKITPVQLIKTLYPMGSMTGAPKIASMKIIEEQEISKRGVYSGSFGYFTPNNDFDFNVIIRSILYNQTEKYVSFSVGGAITSQSDLLAEYQECLLKANAMKKVIENQLYSSSKNSVN